MQSFSTPAILLFWGLFVPALSLGQSLTFDQLLSLHTKPWSEINTTLTAKGWELSSSKSDAGQKKIIWSYGEETGYGYTPSKATGWFNWLENTEYGASIQYQSKKEIFTAAKQRATVLGFKSLDSEIKDDQILEIVGGTQTVAGFAQSVSGDEKHYTIFLLPRKQYDAIKTNEALERALIAAWLSSSSFQAQAPVSVVSSPQQVILSEIARNMVRIPGGSFQMGSNDGENDEKPVHSVNMGSFYMSSTEVTQAQYQAVMGYNPSSFKNCDQCPVENVSWDDAQVFIQKLNQLTGPSRTSGSGGYRLPTEAEWEYAAGGGNGSRTKYAGTNSEGSLGSYAWYEINSNSKTHPVKGKSANALGLYDMSGSVWEWCQDWPRGYPGSSGVTDYTGLRRVLRGGSWGGDSDGCRVAFRNFSSPGSRSYYVGFRLALSQN